MKCYLAGPVADIDETVKHQMDAVYKVLVDAFGKDQVYRPGMHKVPNEWGISMEMWGQCVFTMDVMAMDAAEWIVLCNYGRTGATAGTAWECGYAFAKGKKILIVNMPGVTESSLMVRGCASNVVDFNKIFGNPDISVPSLFIERGKSQVVEILH